MKACTREICEKTINPNLDLQSTLRSINPKRKYWDPDTLFSYHFIGGTLVQRNHVNEGIAKIKAVAPGINFKEVSTNGLIRISFDDNSGSWSFVGTDNKLIDPEQATMNFGWSEDTHRVVIHEWLHALNFSHEHIRGINFDWPKVYAYFAEQGWNQAVVDRNFRFVPEDHDATEIDNESIMKYWVDCSLTLDGLNCGEFNTVLSAGDIKRLNELFPYEDVKPEEPTDPEIPSGCVPAFVAKLFKKKLHLYRLTKPQLLAIVQQYPIEIEPRESRFTLVDKIWNTINV